MKAWGLAVAALLLGVWQDPALAQGSVEERLERMEQRTRFSAGYTLKRDEVSIVPALS